MVSATVLGTLLVLVGIKILADLAGGMYSLEQAFKMLPEGIPETKKGKIEIEEMDIDKIKLNLLLNESRKKDKRAKSENTYKTN